MAMRIKPSDAITGRHPAENGPSATERHQTVGSKPPETRDPIASPVRVPTVSP